jgi:hypothetical protein
MAANWHMQNESRRAKRLESRDEAGLGAVLKF